MGTPKKETPVLQALNLVVPEELFLDAQHRAELAERQEVGLGPENLEGLGFSGEGV